DRVPESLGRIFVAEKTVTGIAPRIVILDNFLDPAGGAGNWQCAVLQTVHRAQTRRLEAGRDQADVHARFENVRAFFVIVSTIRELGWKFSGRDRERSFESRIALAKDHDAHVINQ